MGLKWIVVYIHILPPAQKESLHLGVGFFSQRKISICLLVIERKYRFPNY